MNRRIAFLFPGQGAQFVGMGKSLHKQKIPHIREIYEEAADVLGYDLKKISFDGPEETLKQTIYTQPAILTHSVAVAEALRGEGVKPDFAAGHSLGEYSALVTAGAMSFADALKIVKVRAESMQKAGETRPGTMAAVMGLKAETVQKACQKAARSSIVQPANYNAPDQTVISGEKKGVTAAGDLCKKAGAKRVVGLKVHGAFHSPLMESAVEPLRNSLRQAELDQATVPVVSNVTARPAVRPEEIRELLGLQIVYPVRWTESMLELDRMGTTLYLECGPGSVLRGLLKRILDKPPAEGVSEADELPSAVTAALQGDDE